MVLQLSTCSREMDLGIAPTAKLTVVHVVVLFYMVTKQSNVTNVKCGSTINALSSQNLNLILYRAGRDDVTTGKLFPNRGEYLGLYRCVLIIFKRK